jgi:hypothetical protein
MNTITETSGAHELDGSDPDNLKARPGTRGHAARLVDDLRELERMNEADKRHYASTPGGSKGNSISRG